MKLVLDIKNEEEYKKISNYLNNNHITVIDVQENLNDKIEELSWEMGVKAFSSKDDINDR